MMLLIAATAFVGTHFLMSHPLRAPLVSRLGEKGFLGLYSLVAAATMIWMILAYRAAPVTPMLWPVGDDLWASACSPRWAMPKRTIWGWPAARSTIRWSIMTG